MEPQYAQCMLQKCKRKEEEDHTALWRWSSSFFCLTEQVFICWFFLHPKNIQVLEVVRPCCCCIICPASLEDRATDQQHRQPFHSKRRPWCWYGLDSTSGGNSGGGATADPPPTPAHVGGPVDFSWLVFLLSNAGLSSREQKKSAEDE